MRTIALFTAHLLLTLITNAQQTYVPDGNFENYLETHDADGNTVVIGDTNSMGNGIANDNYVLTSRISNVTALDVSSQNIADLTGIEDFQNLEFLNCYDNALTILNLSGNTALQQLWCLYNQLTGLDVTQNPALQILSCNHNQLSNLNIAQNPDLQYLNCNNNQLTVLDITQNPAIQELYCASNQLANLNTSQNPALQVLSCPYNQLSGLNTSQNPDLEVLYCYNNQLAEIDISQNSGLQKLWCNNNQLTSLDVTQNPALQYLYCQNNEINVLNVTQNSNLKYLYCQYNQLSGLDITQNTVLLDLSCHHNQITELNASQNTNLHILTCQNNQLNSLNIQNGNNHNLVEFNSAYNSGLNCVIVDDVEYMETNWPDAIDSNVIYTDNQEDCDVYLQTTYVPDDNFEYYLETHNAEGISVEVGDENSMGNGIVNDDYVQTIRINNVTNLVVNGQNISDLTGIEDFESLQSLNCYGNLLTNLDISQNTSLLSLGCSNNQLTTLDLSQNISLQELSCNNNQITNLDVSQNTALKFLYCYGNQLTALQITQNTALQSLYCHNNQLTTLDIRNGNNTNLEYFKATGNPDLTCVFVDDADYMENHFSNAIDYTATYVETQAQCDALTGVEEELQDSVHIYPNPTTDKLFIQGENESVFTRMHIYNTQGQRVYSGAFAPYLDLSRFPAGVYWLRLENVEGNRVVYKIVKK